MARVIGHQDERRLAGEVLRAAHRQAVKQAEVAADEAPPGEVQASPGDPALALEALQPVGEGEPEIVGRLEPRTPSPPPRSRSPRIPAAPSEATALTRRSSRAAIGRRSPAASRSPSLIDGTPFASGDTRSGTRKSERRAHERSGGAGRETTTGRLWCAPWAQRVFVPEKGTPGWIPQCMRGQPRRFKTMVAGLFEALRGSQRRVERFRRSPGRSAGSLPSSEDVLQSSARGSQAFLGTVESFGVEL
jgi:hypothetical protein